MYLTLLSLSLKVFELSLSLSLSLSLLRSLFIVALLVGDQFQDLFPITLNMETEILGGKEQGGGPLNTVSTRPQSTHRTAAVNGQEFMHGRKCRFRRSIGGYGQGGGSEGGG